MTAKVPQFAMIGSKLLWPFFRTTQGAMHARHNTDRMIIGGQSARLSWLELVNGQLVGVLGVKRFGTAGGIAIQFRYFGYETELMVRVVCDLMQRCHLRTPGKERTP